MTLVDELGAQLQIWRYTVLREKLEWKVKIALVGTIGESSRGKKNICVTEIVEWFETGLYSQRCSSRSVKLRGHCTRTMCIPYVGNYWNNGWNTPPWRGV